MRPGTKIDDRFVLEREVGSGGMGRVYRAEDSITGATVALKLLHEGAEVARFEREARVLAELDHPSIVRYVSHGTWHLDEREEHRPYLAMEWLEGEDLGARLARGRLAVAETIRLARQVAGALEAAHSRGIIHRDLKPENLFLVGRDVGHVKLVDFGIAGQADATRATKSGMAMGTPGYMAPEQARAESSLDARVDVFSMGCVLFECLTGQPVFAGEHVMAILAKILFVEAPRVRELSPEVPPRLDELVARMLAKKRDDRPPSAREVGDALEGLGRPISVSSRLEPGPAESLSAEEQHVVSVVVVGGTPSEDAATLVAGARPLSGPGPALEVARGFGLRAEPLLDGSVVLVLSGGGAATDQASRAAACALALQTAVPEAAVVLSTGHATTGERLPVGDAIDRAAQLLRLPRPASGGLRLDEMSDALLGQRFARHVDEAGHVLIARRYADAVRTLLGRATPCVGREGEIASVEALLEQSVREPVARAVLVTGPAGVGKSRLRYELTHEVGARHEGTAVWTAQGEPVGTGGAFALAAQLVRHAADILEGEPLSHRHEKLRLLVGRHVPPDARPRVTEFLGEMIGAPFADEGSVPLQVARRDAILMGDQIRRAWGDLIDAETAAHPVLLVLEDLHWGDLPTVGLVDLALRVLPERPLMVLALARPEVDEQFPGLWRDRSVMRMALAPLPRRAAELLVRRVLGAHWPDERVSRLVEHAGGNAFYLEELIRAEASGPGDALPETVLAMVEARLEAEGPEGRRLLRAASVFGQRFWEGGVVALVGGEENRESTRRLLEGLVKRELVTRRPKSRFVGESEYTFRHAIVREAAHGMLTDADRALGHLLAARWLEAVGESDAIVLAEHLERGGEPAKAIGEYLRATRQALEGHDFAAVLARAERGVVAGAEGEPLARLRLAAAEAHRWRGEYREVVAACEDAMRLSAPGHEVWADAARWTSAAVANLGDTDRLVGLAHEIAGCLARGAPSAANLRAAGAAAAALASVGRREPGERLLAAAISSGGLSHADPSVRAALEASLGVVALLDGDPYRFLELMTEAAAAHEEAGDVRAACLARGNVGYALLALGDFAEAEACIRTAVQAGERMGLDSTAWVANQNLAWALARLGRLEEAIALQTTTAEAFCRRNNKRMEADSRTYLAATLLSSGALADAEEQARAAFALSESAPHVRLHAGAVLGKILLARGRAAAALDVVREVMAGLMDVRGVTGEGEGLLHLVYAEALAAAGEHAPAMRAIFGARDRILARAARIPDERLRRSFLEAIPENARTLALATAWLGGRPG